VRTVRTYQALCSTRRAFLWCYFFRLVINSSGRSRFLVTAFLPGVGSGVVALPYQIYCFEIISLVAFVRSPDWMSLFIIVEKRV
jgi:hypothetical protein